MNGLGVAGMKVLEAVDMVDVLSEKLVKDGSLKNTKTKGEWRGCIEVHSVLRRDRRGRRTRKTGLGSQGYKEFQARE